MQAKLAFQGVPSNRTYADEKSSTALLQRCQSGIETLGQDKLNQISHFTFNAQQNRLGLLAELHYTGCLIRIKVLLLLNKDPIARLIRLKSAEKS